MKNEHILNLHQVVPIEIRLEVYKEAILALKQTDSDKYSLIGSKGLCLLLPCILWDLETFSDETPEYKNWDWHDATIAFPELTEKVIKLLKMFQPDDKKTFAKSKNAYRITFIKQWIEDLTNQLILES